MLLNKHLTLMNRNSYMIILKNRLKKYFKSAFVLSMTDEVVSVSFPKNVLVFNGNLY